MEGNLDNSLEQAHLRKDKDKLVKYSYNKNPKEKSSLLCFPRRFRSHTPQAMSHILLHLPIIASGSVPKNLLKLFFASNDDFILLVDDSTDNKKIFPLKFSSSLDITLSLVLNTARFSGKVAMIVVPNTLLARKINDFLQTCFGAHCQVATTISSLSDDVSCELFGDNHIILSTFADLLRKLLAKDLPTIHSIVFYHPLNHQNHSLLTTYLFDVLLLRLEFSSRSNSSLRKIFLCDPCYFTNKGYQLLTKCSNIFSLGSHRFLDESLYPPNAKDIYKHAFIPMFGLLYRRHLSRKQLFTEMRSSYLYRNFQAAQEAEKNNLSFHSLDNDFELFFNKQLYKAFVRLSHPSLGPFVFVEKSNNRYILSAFGEEFLSAVTYSSSSSLMDIINLIDFLCLTMNEKSLSWDSFLEYLLKSFPVNNAYSYNQSFNHLLAFIQQVREIYDTISDADVDSLPLKLKTKLSKLLLSRKYSYGDFQNMKLLKCVGQRFGNTSLNYTLQAIDDQMLKSFYHKKVHRKKKMLYNRQKMLELVLSEVLSSDKPQTIPQVALSLNLNRNLTDRILRSYIHNEYAIIIARTVITTDGRRTFFGSQHNFPENFEYTCADCQFYTITGICAIFSTLARLAPHKLSYQFRARAEKVLNPGTISCSALSLKKLKQETFTLEEFGDLTREVQGLTESGTIFHHKCIYCSSVIAVFGTENLPRIGTSTISCSYCGSLFKLSRNRDKSSSKKILVKCFEGNLNVFVNTLYELSGLVWDEHKRELVPLHGMTIRVGEKVSLDGEYLVIENVNKKIDELEYLYSSTPLSHEIVNALKKNNVQVRYNPIAVECKTNISYTESMTTEQIIAMRSLRVSYLLSNQFLHANLISRWIVTIRLLLLLDKELIEEDLLSCQLFEFEWQFMDILKLSSNVHHPYTVLICEGLAGNLMWLFLKEVFSQNHLNLFSRVHDRYVKEKEFYPAKRTLAYSAISALVNFFLLLIQDYLKILHKQERLPWKGSLGFIHGTKKASALHEFGFFLDFIDQIKIAAFYFIAKAISDNFIGFSDVEEFISPSGATLYAVKLDSIAKLESLLEEFFAEKITYSNKEVSFEEAYIIYIRDFFKLIDETINTLKAINLTIASFKKSAFMWLQSWENLSIEERDFIANNIREELSVALANLSFKPYSYLPSFLQKRFDYFQASFQSLERFNLFDDWEECILRKNNIQTFLYQDDFTIQENF